MNLVYKFEQTFLYIILITNTKKYKKNCLLLGFLFAFEFLYTADHLKNIRIYSNDFLNFIFQGAPFMYKIIGPLKQGR